MNMTRPTSITEIRRSWHLVDCKGQVLGRIATTIASFLIGKDKPNYVPYLDCGDYVVVVNAKDIRVTGKKSSQKLYMHYSGYPGGLKKKSFQQVIAENPTRAIQEAVSGMLPKNKLQASMMTRLRIFPESEHPFADKVSIS